MNGEAPANKLYSQDYHTHEAPRTPKKTKATRPTDTAKCRRPPGSATAAGDKYACNKRKEKRTDETEGLASVEAMKPARS